MSDKANIIRPKLFRHLMVMIYDLLLLVACLLLATFIIVALNGGEAIGQGNPFFIAYLLGVSFTFYGWFWTHGGQTLGMRSWKVTLYSEHQHGVNWQQALLRFVISILAWIPFGFGIWWQFLSKDNQSWPDRLSGTYLHYDKKVKNKPLSRLS
tara:strand:- start:690 stop:1148 length:459 start_codon:yes stop_codon:yes gene_type:complete